MRGITEERLRKKLSYIDDEDFTISGSIEERCLHELLDECEELNPWRPIDEDTPQKELLLWSKEYGKYVGNHGTLAVLKLGFTHWMELPEAPK